nr:hypothetical protein 12 [Desulfobacterales bacterium]
MKINTNESRADLGFQIPEPGVYIFEASEGIDLFTNENSGKTSLKVPTKIVESVDGGDGSVGMTVTHFVPIESKWGEKQLASLLTITDLAPAFEKRFPDDTSFLDKTFIDSVKLKLPGKLFRGEIEIRQNNKGQKNANFKSWEKLSTQKTSAAATEGGQADEDW